MHPLKITSILLFLAGAIIFFAGLLILWKGNPPYGTASVLIAIGLLFALGAIIMLCVSLQYDMKMPIT